AGREARQRWRRLTTGSLSRRQRGAGVRNCGPFSGNSSGDFSSQENPWQPTILLLTPPATACTRPAGDWLEWEQCHASPNLLKEEGPPDASQTLLRCLPPAVLGRRDPRCRDHFLTQDESPGLARRPGRQNDGRPAPLRGSENCGLRQKSAAVL